MIVIPVAVAVAGSGEQYQSQNEQFASRILSAGDTQWWPGISPG